VGGRHGAFETGARPQDAVTRIEIERNRATGRDTSRTATDTPVPDAKEAVKEAARDVKHAVRETARDARDTLEHEAESQAERGKTAASHRVDSFARALRHAGESLEEEGEEDLARYGRDTAAHVERFADSLDRRDVGAHLHALQATARHTPAAVLGSTFAAGLLMGRVLRTSTPHRSGETYQAGYERPRERDPVRDADRATDGPQHGYETQRDIIADSTPGREPMSDLDRDREERR
jgi:hypothetical protein